MHFSPTTQKDIYIIFHQNALIVANEKIFFKEYKTRWISMLSLAKKKSCLNIKLVGQNGKGLC
jgi:hypothetical protein